MHINNIIGTKCSPKEWKDKINRSCLTYSQRGYCKNYNNLMMKRYQKDGYTGTNCKECGCNEFAGEKTYLLIYNHTPRYCLLKLSVTKRTISNVIELK